MDTITVLGIAALASIFVALTALGKTKRQRVKPSPAPITTESQPPPAQLDIPPKPAQLEEDSPPKLAQLEEDSPAKPAQLEEDSPAKPAQLEVECPPKPTQLEVESPPKPTQLEVESPPKPAQLEVESPPRPAQLKEESPAKPAQLEEDSPAKPAQLEDESPAKPAQLEAESPAKPAQLEEDSPAKPAQLEDESPAKPAQLEAESPAKPAQLEEDSPAKPAQLEADSPAKPAQLEVESPPKLAQLEAESPPKPAQLEEDSLPKPAQLEEESPSLPTVDDTIFINHRSINQDGVETLARNLNNIGYPICLDIWKTAPKQPFDFDAYHALQTHSQAILVVTPEAMESGWVREEYELMLKRQQHDPDFTVIPVVLDDTLSASPFLSGCEIINLSTAEYPEAFQRLVSHFGNKSFSEKDLELPATTVTPTVALTNGTCEFIATRFSHFEQNSPSPLILLAQSDRNQAPMVEALLTEAKTRYQADHCLHIALPYSVETDTLSYFSALAQQCGLTEIVNNGIEFEQALLARLNNQTAPFFLLVSRFEHGAQSTRQQFAGMVRSLNESHANQLHIVLCGGEKLAELKYPHHSPSVLNTAEVYQWPEFERADVYAMQDTFGMKLALDDESADKLLILSGGHPVLLQKCLQLCQNEPTLDWQDYPAALSRDPFVWRLFAPFRKEEATQVREWLTQEKVAPSSAWFSYDHQRQALLQRLYWNNLLVERFLEGRKQLCWRCEALRLAGKEILL